jgi:hypothetical protein
MEFPIELNGLFTKVKLNNLPLGSYDALISMDWFEEHSSKLYCYEKVIYYINDDGNPHLVKGIPKRVSFKNISTLQLKIFLGMVVSYMQPMYQIQ